MGIGDIIMNKYFNNISPIIYKPKSEDMLSYKFYNSNKEVLGKKMSEHLKIAICCWHNFCWEGNDNFGNATRNMPWQCNDKIKQSYNKIDALFEFIEKLGIDFFTFHDIDIIPNEDSIKKYIYNIQKITDYIKAKIKETKINLLWGTANLFSHKRYQSGAATNPDPDIFAYAATQVKYAMEATQTLKGKNYVLWN